MKGVLPIWGWVLVGLALLVSFGLDFANTAQGGAIDLRNRITGLRLLERGIDPYHYKWSRSEPEAYCDPFNNPKLTVSRTTATPTLLLPQVPLAPLPYRLAQFLWFFIQWLLLLGTGWLWLRACTTLRQRCLVLAFVTGFSYTAAWRLHTERGQSYVLLAFVFAWWLTLTLNPKRGFWTGCLAGLLVALRPPFLILAPILGLHRRGQLLGAAVGLIVAVALPLLWLPGCWSDYASAMQTNADLNRTHDYPHFSQAYPPTVEGVPTDILAHYAPIPFAEYSFSVLVSACGFQAWPDAVPLVLVAIPFAIWLGWSRARSVEHVLPALAAWFYLIDLFLPAYRNTYNDVLILDVVCLAIITTAKIPWAVWPCALALPVGWVVYANTADEVWKINLPSMLFTLGAVLTIVSPTFVFNNRARSRKVAAAC